MSWRSTARLRVLSADAPPMISTSAANPEIDVGHLPQAARCRHSWQLHVSTHVAVLGTAFIEKSSGTVVSPYQVLQTWGLKNGEGERAKALRKTRSACERRNLEPL